jgi:uncharacterized SAM-binding protein YcdF (DUF218 family)
MGLAVGSLLGLLAKDLGLNSLVSYWKDLAPWIVLAGLTGALLWRTRLRWLYGGTALGLGMLWLVVAFTPVTVRMAQGLPRNDPLRPADAVFILASYVQMDGELSAVAMSRLLHGLELVAQGHAPRLIVSELPPPSPPYAEAARNLMLNLGMKHDVLAVGPVGNTRDEAIAVGQLIRERGWTKLLLVTSPTHSRRASAAFEKEGMEVISSPSVQTRFDLESLEHFDDRIRAFGSLIHEWVGLWFYRLRGWID